MTTDRGTGSSNPKGDSRPEWASRWSFPPVAASVLDATVEPVDGITAYPTRYVPSRLLVSTLRDVDEAIAVLTKIADTLGWVLSRDEGFVTTRIAESEAAGAARRRRLPWASGQLGLARLILTASSVAQQAPDSWVLLQRARREWGIGALQGIGLDHVISISSPFGMTPFGMTPFGMTPFGMTPFGMTGAVNPIASYGYPGSGGLQPVAFVGEAPRRTLDKEYRGRRPVIGTLDTGCGAHPWLDAIVRTRVDIDGVPIGLVDPSTDPEIWGDQFGPLDGALDQVAGHGTFIAGVLRQAAPDADIVAWRVAASDGTAHESDVVNALTGIAELVRRHANGEPEGLPLDVLSLSMGYYHETPTDDRLLDQTLQELLAVMGRCGTIVVCSAGNDATARPMFPAAFGPWVDGSGPCVQDPDATSIVSVGALNPNRSTVALFSNTGPWVRVYERGVSVVSTIPVFEAGSMPAGRTVAYGLDRDSIDPDDYRGGFAVWSGTSFASPLVAGRLAAQLDGTLLAAANRSAAEVVNYSWKAIEKVTALVRQ
ncbi:S8 family serine peptidase [Salinibacterium sp.]|uniref:S8 family peptidase n=1 Tax=Salinibacterium sp. TaxID=1915057 RepID=UPI00286D51A8|nr:S8 family serine peptidase [Salinibacterium sp.]